MKIRKHYYVNISSLYQRVPCSTTDACSFQKEYKLLNG